MSLFGKIFGGKSSKPEPTTQGALQDLGGMEELLIKKQEYLNRQIETSVLTAKKYVATNKRLALKALKEKKVHEKNLEQIEGILNTIHHQKSSLENAALHAEVLGVMTKTSAALKTTHKGMDVDKVHDLMEEIAEQQEVSNEITQAISNPIGLQTDVDDEDLMKELEEMEEAELNEKLLDVGPVPVENVADRLPEAPKDKLPKAKSKKEEDDLAELEAWANA